MHIKISRSLSNAHTSPGHKLRCLVLKLSAENSSRHRCSPISDLPLETSLTLMLSLLNLAVLPKVSPVGARFSALLSHRRAGCACGFHQCCRDIVPNCAVRSFFVVVSYRCPAGDACIAERGRTSNFSAVSSRPMNQWAFKHSARNLPLKASI